MLQPYIESVTALSDMFIFWRFLIFKMSLPARASEQGNVIGLVSVYIYIYIL